MSKRFIGLIAGSALLFPLAHQAHAQAGAKTPFTTLEAEAGTAGGGAVVRSFVLGSPVPTAPTLELEASGGALVELNATGQSVSWTNPVANANTIVIRNSIPDAPNGGGITATIDLYVDGVFRQAITVSSKQSWVYRNSTTTPDDPHAGGTPMHFYNEDRAFISGPAIAAGSTIKLQKDAANAAAVYDIDAIDLENVAPPLTQPANSLSVISCGADPTFTKDSTLAIQTCINDARTQGKSVWIPPGKYLVASLASTPLNLTGVAVHGAGMWHTMIYRNVPLPPPTQPWRSEVQVGSGSTLTDLSIDSNSIYRDVGGPGGGSSGITAKGTGWLIDRVWVQHCDAQWLSGTNGTIQNSRVADSWADGINLNNGNTPDPEKAGINLTAQNNFVRGGGDDGIATYSDSGPSGANPEMDGTHILNNTSVAPFWANALRIAGGRNVVVKNNLVTDPAANSGMEVSVFGTTGHPLDSATISGNVILRGGGWNGTNRHGMNVGSHGSGNFANTFTNATITNNTIQDSRRVGLNITPTLEKLTISGNVIDHPALQGIRIDSGVTGTGSFDSNTVSNLNTGEVVFQNDSGGTFNATLTNNSWQGPPAPTGLAVTFGINQVVLRWTASSGATGYNVKRATVSGGPYATVASVTTTSYTDTGLTGGKTYYYVVSAVNSSGGSPNSSQVSGTPQANSDFSISATPNSQTVAPGGGTAYTTSVSAVNGFTGAASLSVGGLPSGAAGRFNPTSVPGSGTSTLTVTTSSSTPAGSYPLTITGTSGSLSHSTAATLVVSSSCVTGSAGDGWHNTRLSAAQTGTFSVQYDATPSASPLNAVIGLSQGTQTAYTGFAALTRFNQSGSIDARNGGAYATQSAIPFSAGLTYHFRLVINIPADTYWIFVTPPGGKEQTVGSNFAFRTEQNAVTALDAWGLDVNSSDPGSMTICNFTMQ
jgi:hypothetical protein